MNTLFKIFLFVIYADVAWSAACCGGGFASPSLIAGDERMQMTGTFSQSEISDDVFASGWWKKRQTTETNQTFRVDGAYVIEDIWQVGASVPIVRRSRAEESSTGLGDVAATLGYEYLTNWDYNPYRPKGIGFLQLILPTGRSVRDAKNIYGLDSRGRGFWALGVGTLLTKTVRQWDLFLSFDAHKSFASRENKDETNLHPGYGGNLGIGFGYNTAKFRVGPSLTWTYEDPIRTTGENESNGSPQRFATATLSGSYLFDESWATTLSYSDQTLFGSPVNSSLGQTVAIQLQRRWSR